MSSGRRGGFRIYKASDGTKAQVSYARFETVQDANRQTQLWLKVAGKTLFETDRQDSRGELTETRTITQGRDEESGRRSFMIIKRNGTTLLFRSVTFLGDRHAGGRIDPKLAATSDHCGYGQNLCSSSCFGLLFTGFFINRLRLGRFSILHRKTHCA